MRRTIPLLSGLAILGVIFNHANWHALREFTPGDPAGYPYLITDQVGKFAIVAFLFIAGYFSAYATSGGKKDLSWGIVRARLLGLLWPWLIWSVFFTVAQTFQGRAISLEEFFRNLFIQYYFIPLLMFYYLLAPGVARWAKNNAVSLLITATIVQLLGIGVFYLRVYWPDFPNAVKPWIDIGPVQYLRFAFAFPLGMVAGIYPKQIKAALDGWKRPLPWILLAIFVLSALETFWAYNYAVTHPAVWPIGGDQTRLTAALFSLTFVACFIVFDNIKVPIQKRITKLGTRSYGLYLSHYVILGVLGKLLQRALPKNLAEGWLSFLLLFVLTTVLAAALMELVARSPAKPLYKYIFG